MAHEPPFACTCSVVADMLHDPTSGLTVQADGTFIFDDPHVRYYCPTCKGRLPNVWNARITDAERERLQHLMDGIASAEEAIQRLGTPDYDAWMQHWDHIGGELVWNERLSNKCRNIEYYHLSECANLEFYFDEDHGPEARIMLKFWEQHDDVE